jgi:hypothetical protein
MTGMADIGTADPDHGGEVTIPGAGGGPERPARSARAANTGPVAEDEVTEWLGDLRSRPADGQQDGLQPDPAGPWWPGARVTACTVAVSLVIGVLAAVAFRHYTRPSPDAVATSREAAVRDETARWVAQQVSQEVVVSCDQAMCAALTADGFPARRLMELGPTSPAPDSTAVVVETPAVRTLFGSSLDAAWAPAVLAAFGSGTDRVTIRVIAPHGAAVYQVLVEAGLATRKAAGAALLHDPRISVPAPAAGQLTAGLVDSRLLRALTALARHQPITIIGFRPPGPGASPGLPLRSASLAEEVPAAHLTGAAYARSARAYLSTMKSAFHLTPATTMTPPHGPPILQVQVTAPSPLG